MTSATEELRRLLDKREVKWSATIGANGTIWTHWDAFNGHRVHAMDNEDGTVEIFDQWFLTPAQAVEATLGPRKQPPYDELIEALRRDWDIEASWDGLRRFWYVGLTDEGVRKRDEREATLGRGTCRLPKTRIDHGRIEYNGTTEWRMCSACGEEVLAYPAHFCPNCGREVAER